MCVMLSRHRHACVVVGRAGADRLLEEYPDLVYAMSSAQQYAWVKQNYPTVWEGIRQAIADGSWIPVGSQWVEPDGNLPGGEAMVRQLTHGIRFFRASFTAGVSGASEGGGASVKTPVRC